MQEVQRFLFRYVKGAGAGTGSAVSVAGVGTRFAVPAAGVGIRFAVPVVTAGVSSGKDGFEHIPERREIGAEDGKLVIGKAACKLTGNG